MQMAHAAPNISRSIRDRYGVVRYGMVSYHIVSHHTNIFHAPERYVDLHFPRGPRFSGPCPYHSHGGNQGGGVVYALGCRSVGRTYICRMASVRSTPLLTVSYLNCVHTIYASVHGSTACEWSSPACSWICGISWMIRATL